MSENNNSMAQWVQPTEDTPIRGFYKDKTIFITGGTGFVGKVLLEKLIFACQELRRVYILVREKKGVPPEHRLEALLNSAVFTGTNRTPYELLKQKIVAIYGDASQKRLGLCDADWDRLVDEVNVIFNSAASVRFDDPMIKALGINCRSTMSCLQLCKEAKNCVAYVHVSTCYANCNLKVVEEKVYPQKVTVEHLMEMAKWMPSDQLDKLCKEHLFDGRPNSYVFTKALAEEHLSNYGKGLPVAIARLSMVVASRTEPEVGFIDVTQACVFVGFTQAIGALRTFRYNPDLSPECMAVDYAANALISIAWLTATRYREKPIQVYNISKRLITAGDLFKMTNDQLKKHPTIKAFRPPADLSKSHYGFWYHYNRWISEWLFVLTLQCILRIFGFKHDLVSKMKLLDDARETLQHFSLTDWQFPNANFDRVHSEMDEKDRKIFKTDINDNTREEHLKELEESLPKGWACMRKYKMGEDLSNPELAHKRLRMLHYREIAFNVFMYTLWFGLFYGLYKLISVGTELLFDWL